MAMSKTEALKTARANVGAIIRRSATDFVYYSPYYGAQNLDGPSSASEHTTRAKAQASRAECIALIALGLMGYSDQDAAEAAYMARVEGSGDVATVFEAALADLVKAGAVRT